jgi:hypothetical protein
MLVLAEGRTSLPEEFWLRAESYYLSALSQTSPQRPERMEESEPSPRRSAVPAGLEPAAIWLTASRTTVVLRDNMVQSGWSDSNRRSPAPKAGGPPALPHPETESRTSHMSCCFTPPRLGQAEVEGDRTLLIRPGGRIYPVCKLLPLGTAFQSVQRESNPHVDVGNVTGCRYIMDAVRKPIRAGGGTRTHFIRVTRAVPGLSSIAGLCQQPVLVSSQLDRGSEPLSPSEGLAILREYPGQESNLGLDLRRVV